jgi:hypothetical protein
MVHRSAVTNRIFSVRLELAAQNISLFSKTLVVRPLLLADGKQVGVVGMAIDAVLDDATRAVTLAARQAGKHRIPTAGRLIPMQLCSRGAT